MVTEPPPTELARTLDLGGYNWKAVGSAQEPEGRWLGAVVAVDENPEDAFGFCRALKRRGLDIPVLLLISGTHLDELEMRDDLFTDFCLTPFHQRELEARLSHLVWRSGTALRPELIEYGPLVLNVETYQATIAGRPLDLTYMEYELARQGVHPGDAAQPGLGLRLLRRRPHRRRPRPPPASQTRRRTRRPHHHREVRRLPLRPLPLGALTAQAE